MDNQGWREFFCHSCGFEWERIAKDHTSEAEMPCPNCSEPTKPCAHRGNDE